MVGYEILYMGLYCFCVPGVFDALLSSGPTIVSIALSFCERLWKQLVHAEEIALRDPWVSDFLENLLWPNNPWIRSILISLRECNFELVPEDLLDQLSQLFSTHGTKQVEDGFNWFRRYARGNMKGAFSPVMQWHRGNFANLLEEHGWPRIPTTVED